MKSTKLLHMFLKLRKKPKKEQEKEKFESKQQRLFSVKRRGKRRIVGEARKRRNVHSLEASTRRELCFLLLLFPSIRKIGERITKFMEKFVKQENCM